MSDIDMMNDFETSGIVWTFTRVIARNDCLQASESQNIVYTTRLTEPVKKDAILSTKRRLRIISLRDVRSQKSDTHKTVHILEQAVEILDGCCGPIIIILLYLRWPSLY